MKERVGDEKLMILSVTVRGINDQINGAKNRESRRRQRQSGAAEKIIINIIESCCGLLWSPAVVRRI